MSLPEERPSFKDPSSPIGRVQSGLAASFLFESGNNEQANLPNNNINKGRWTEEEHKIFMQEYEYDWMRREIKFIVKKGLGIVHEKFLGDDDAQSAKIFGGAAGIATHHSKSFA